MTDKERYATIGTWVEVFRKEGVSVSQRTVRARLKIAGIIGTTARNRTGRPIVSGFYAESCIRKLLSDLIRGLPQAGENGTFEKDGETYGTVESLSRLINISTPTIKSRIMQGSLTVLEGRSFNGGACDFYVLSEVQRLCTDLLQDIPQAGENGFIEKDGQTYGTISALSGLLNVSTAAIQNRVDGTVLKSIHGKNIKGRICAYYLLSEVQRLCADLLQDIPQAGENGTFEKDGETYGTIKSFARLFGVSKRTISSRLRHSGLKPTRGKLPGGQLYDFFPQSDVRVLCDDCLQELPQAGENGLFERNGKTYGTVASLSRSIGLSTDIIVIRLQRASLKSIEGRDRCARVQPFYPLDEVRKFCEDFFQELPQAGEDGTFEKDGEIYGTINSLAKILHFSPTTVGAKIRKGNSRAINGKDKNGHICHLYSLIDVHSLCADLITKREKA